MTHQAVNDHARPQKPKLNLDLPVFLPVFLRKPDATDDLAAYELDQSMKRIALGVTNLCDADTVPWVAREVQRHFWKLLDLDEPGRRFDGPPEPHYDEHRLYWHLRRNLWPEEKPFKPRMEVAEMQSKLRATAFTKPVEECVVDRNLSLLKELLKLTSLEVSFLTAAWCASRWNHHCKDSSPLVAGLRLCQIGRVEPKNVPHRRAALLAVLLDAHVDDVLTMVGRINEFLCLGILDEYLWCDDTSDLFDLLQMPTAFLEVLETEHQNTCELEGHVFTMDRRSRLNDTETGNALVSRILSAYDGELRIAYLCSALNEPLDAASIRVIANRLTGLNLEVTQTKPLEGRLVYEGIVSAAVKTALKTRAMQSRLSQYEFLRSLFLEGLGLDSQRKQQASTT